MCKVGKTEEVIIDGKSISIDSCIADEVRRVNRRFRGLLRSVASCCGHGKYPKTIVLEVIKTGEKFEYYSDIKIPRSRNLYYKDKKGIFHLPEHTRIWLHDLWVLDSFGL